MTTEQLKRGNELVEEYQLVKGKLNGINSRGIAIRPIDGWNITEKELPEGMYEAAKRIVIVGLEKRLSEIDAEFNAL